MRFALIICMFLTACTVPGHYRHIEIVAPADTPAGGVPYVIAEFDPWTVRQAEGCLLPGEMEQLHIPFRGYMLMLSLPGQTYTFRHPDKTTGAPVAGAELSVSGTGKKDNPLRLVLPPLEDAVGKGIGITPARALCEAV